MQPCMPSTAPIMHLMFTALDPLHHSPGLRMKISELMNKLLLTGEQKKGFKKNGSLICSNLKQCDPHSPPIHLPIKLAIHFWHSKKLQAWLYQRQFNMVCVRLICLILTFPANSPIMQQQDSWGTPTAVLSWAGNEACHPARILLQAHSRHNSSLEHVLCWFSDIFQNTSISLWEPFSCFQHSSHVWFVIPCALKTFFTAKCYMICFISEMLNCCYSSCL